MDQNSKVFNDAVHGSIEIHPLGVKIIDTPQFQRLRFIKQLGCSSFVFPSGSNNRFEHSLGVCHLAGLLVRALKHRQPELQLTDKDVLCVELAGLCHDLGHGPFSHLWEYFVRKMRPAMGWKHEQTSVDMFEYLIKVNHLEDAVREYGLNKLDLIFIKELIARPQTPEGEEESEWPYVGRPPQKGFLYQIVANHESGVDVDKWDYFLRDGHSLGLQVTFDYTRLVKFSRVINVSGTDAPNMKLCFRDKEVMNLYDMFHTRMMLHKKAYQHRVVKILDTMLIDALILANDHITYRGKDGTKLGLCDVVNDLEALTFLNDDVFHRIHRSSSTEEEMKQAKQIIHNILTRRYYPCVGYTVPTTDAPRSENLLRDMGEQLPPGARLKKEDIEVHFITVNYGTGKENPILKVGFFTKEDPNICREHRPKDVSKMLPAEWEERVIRVVCRKYDQGLLEEAKLAFTKTCDKFQIPRPTWKSGPNSLTPMKMSTSGTELHNGLNTKRNLEYSN